ncbi:MAG: GTPase Era [Candidatus Omnitrophica bacterium]|nr:GTPase Era [Candidatus Omnitrophota bacterium]
MREFKSGYVALLGKPNVGKSTLLNCFVQEPLAIISPKPQTTRDVIFGIRTDDSAQVIFVDTPGLHLPKHALGEQMVTSARQAGSDADIVLAVVDAEAGIRSEDKAVLDFLRQRGHSPRVWTAVLINKIDRVSPDTVALVREVCRKRVPDIAVFAVSARNAENIDAVLAEIRAHLPEGPLYYPADQLTDRHQRFIAAEFIREQVLLHCQEEVPHAVAVVVEEFKENPGRKIVIGATIYVERESQKRIVIGAGGAMLKTIGTASRHRMEQFLGQGVFLQLWVKVRERWRKDDFFLRQLGYCPKN